MKRIALFLLIGCAYLGILYAQNASFGPSSVQYSTVGGSSSSATAQNLVPSGALYTNNATVSGPGYALSVPTGLYYLVITNTDGAAYNPTTSENPVFPGGYISGTGGTIIMYPYDGNVGYLNQPVEEQVYTSNTWNQTIVGNGSKINGLSFSNFSGILPQVNGGTGLSNGFAIQTTPQTSNPWIDASNTPAMANGWLATLPNGPAEGPFLWWAQNASTANNITNWGLLPISIPGGLSLIGNPWWLDTSNMVKAGYNNQQIAIYQQYGNNSSTIQAAVKYTGNTNTLVGVQQPFFCLFNGNTWTGMPQIGVAADETNSYFGGQSFNPITLQSLIDANGVQHYQDQFPDISLASIGQGYSSIITNNPQMVGLLMNKQVFFDICYNGIRNYSGCVDSKSGQIPIFVSQITATSFQGRPAWVGIPFWQGNKYSPFGQSGNATNIDGTFLYSLAADPTSGDIRMDVTNTAPANTTTPKLWKNVYVNGVIYKMPLYQ